MPQDIEQDETCKEIKNMKMKKTWFSYLLWLVYTTAAGILLAAGITSVSVSAWGLTKYVTAAVVCIFFALAGGVWLAGRKASELLCVRMPKDPHFYNMWECFLSMCLFAGAILLRLHYLLHLDAAPQAGKYFELAQVQAGGKVPELASGAAYVYTAVLSALFTFFGNRIIIGIFFQFFVQLLILPVLYFAVRFLAGRLPALTAAAFAALSPIFMKSMCALSPENLYLLFYSFGLFLMGLYMDKLQKGGCRGRGATVGLLLLGAYAGIVGWMDLTGFSLLFFAAAAFFAAQGEQAAKRPAGRGLIGILSGTILVFLLLILADAAYSGQPFIRILSSWGTQYMENGGTGGRLVWPAAAPLLWLAAAPVTGIVVSFTAALEAVGFWFHKTQRSDAWTGVLLVFLLCGILCAGPMDYGIFTAVVFTVFSGLGLSSIPAESGEEEKHPGKRGEEQSMEAAAAGTGKAADKNKWAAFDPAVTQETEQEDDGLEEVKIEGMPVKKTIRFIENPLPLPKKHVRREMGFGVQPGKEELEFDITVDENDDFDLE